MTRELRALLPGGRRAAAALAVGVKGARALLRTWRRPHVTRDAVAAPGCGEGAPPWSEAVPQPCPAVQRPAGRAERSRVTDGWP